MKKGERGKWKEGVRRLRKGKKRVKQENIRKCQTASRKRESGSRRRSNGKNECFFSGTGKDTYYCKTEPPVEAGSRAIRGNPEHRTNVFWLSFVI